MFAKVYQYKFGTVAEAKVAASFCADNLGKKISKYKFQSLNVMDPESMQNVINVIDRSNGYVRTADERKFAETGQSTYIEELAQAHGSFWEGGDVND